jgi:RNA polymerase sigma factor (sigma-70 family)
MTEDHEIPEVDHVPVPARGASDAALVARVRAEDPHAFGELYDLYFDRVLDLAYRIVWDKNTAADVAQDAFLSAWRNLDRLEDPNAFGGWLLRIARNGALDRKRRDQRTRSVDETQLAMIERTQLRPEEALGSLDDPARVAEDASYVALLWDAADALGERDREVLDLSLRHGMAPAEIADVMNLNRNAANQLVHRVRNRLGAALGARMLWRSGQPECAELRAELVANDVERFDSEAVRVTDRHAGGCAECSERRTLRLDPARLFAAIPIMAVPSLKAKVAHGLEGEGVPMDGSRAFDDLVDDELPSHGARRALIATGIGAAIVIIVLIVGAIALSDDDPSTVAVAPDSTTTTKKSTTTTTKKSTTTTSTSTTTSSTTTTTTTVVPIAAPTAPPTAAPTPTTVRVTTTTTIPRSVTFSLAPDEEDTNYPTSSGPLLTWRVTGAARVSVEGPGLDSAAKSGSERVCAGNIIVSAGECVTPPGEYTYVLEAYDSGDKRFARRTVVLTIS